MVGDEETPKAQVDNLGDRLRAGLPNDNDLDLLDAYRQSFELAYRKVVNMIRVTSGDTPTGRPGKSTTSIIAKLNRETMRLSQMQDIAGCRLVVDDLEAQQAVVRRLQRQLAALGKVKSVDRRRRPSHGYRAVHLIVTVNGKPVEIQVRTLYQHLWAELSESAADRHGNQVKYGGDAPTRPDVRQTLDALSEALAELELAAPDVEESEAMKAIAAGVALLIAGVIIERET
jgi:ppGpp synthetase/RelA/SpoT-type nucleotidyltranferase